VGRLLSSKWISTHWCGGISCSMIIILIVLFDWQTIKTQTHTHTDTFICFGVNCIPLGKIVVLHFLLRLKYICIHILYIKKHHLEWEKGSNIEEQYIWSRCHFVIIEMLYFANLLCFFYTKDLDEFIYKNASQSPWSLFVQKKINEEDLCCYFLSRDYLIVFGTRWPTSADDRKSRDSNKRLMGSVVTQHPVVSHKCCTNTAILKVWGAPH